MRILFLTHRLPYAPNRGDRIRAYHLLREMSRFASVSLFSFVHDAEEASRVAEVRFATSVTTCRVTRARNLALGALRLGTVRPLTHSLLDAPDAVPILREIVQREPPDLVVAYCSGMARFALESPLRGLPFVLDLVDVDSAKWAELRGQAAAPRRWIYGRESTVLGAFEAQAATAAEATLVVNEREREAIKRLAPGARIHVVPNGIDLDAFRPPAPLDDSAEVVFCGVMDYPPNEAGVRWFAREVWPIVRRARPDARFTIVGSNPSPSVQALATADSTISVTGPVRAVQPYLWRAAVSVAPLRTARGLQNKVLEALAAGLPVVATREVARGLPAAAQGGCLEAADAASFAAHTLDLLTRSALERRRIAECAAVDGLTWSHQLGSLRSILADAAMGQRRRAV